MAFPNDRYYYDWSDKRGKDYRLYLSIGDNTYNAYNSMSSTSYNDVKMPSDWIIKTELNAGYDLQDRVNIGIEQPKELTITWDLSKLSSDVETALYNGSNETTSSNQTFQLHNGYSKFETNSGAQFDNFRFIDFFYENRVELYDYDGSNDATSNLLFEGVQEINLDNDIRDNELDTSFNCIGSKALELIRPNFRTLNISYTDGATGDWSQDEQEHVVMYSGRIQSGSNDVLHPSFQCAYIGDNWAPEKPSFISYTFAELFDRIEFFAGYLIKAWRRGNTANFIFSSNIFQALTLYKQQANTNTLGSLSTLGTYDFDTAGVEISSPMDLRFIALTTSKIGTYDYSGGLLFNGGDFESTKTCWNLIDEILDGFLGKMVFTYTSTTTVARFLYVDSGHQTKLTIPSRELQITEEKYNFGRISFAVAEAPNMDTGEKIGSSKAGSYESIWLGQGNKNFDSNDIKLLLHNMQSPITAIYERETRGGSDRYRFMNSSNGWQNGIYSEITFGVPSLTTDDSICLIHDKCKVTKDGTAEIETFDTSDYDGAGNSFEDVTGIIKNVSEYFTNVLNNSTIFIDFEVRGKTGFYEDILNVTARDGALVGEYERLRNQYAGLAHLIAKASVKWYGVNRHYLKITAPSDVIDVTQLGSQIDFSSFSDVTYYNNSTGNYVMVGYKSDFEGRCTIDLLEVK